MPWMSTRCVAVFPFYRVACDVSLSQYKRDKLSGLTRRAKRRKIAVDEDEVEKRAIGTSIRSAKKAMRPAKIGISEPRLQSSKRTKMRGGTKKLKDANSFGSDLGQRTVAEGTRAKKGDSVGRAGKRPRKSR